MKVKELIELLEEMPQDMEVTCDYDGGYSTAEINGVGFCAKYYNTDNERVVVIF